jgi:hypothetical protein
MPNSTNSYDRSVKSLNNSEHYEFSGESEYSRERSDPYQMVEYLIDHGLSFRERNKSESLPSDGRIAEEVKEILTRESLLDSSDIDVTVTNGQVLLTGTVVSRKIKRLAELSVENLSGVRVIINQLKLSDGTKHAYKN